MERREFIRQGGKALILALLPWQLVRAAPRPTEYGVAVCPYCSMTVVDLRFAAQVITPTGQVHSYDAIECLADHLVGHGPKPPEVAGSYLANYHASTREEVSYLAVEEAVVLHHPRLRSPMGGGLAAFETAEEAAAFAVANRLTDAATLTWDGVLALGGERPWVPDY